ncbi:MAG: RNA polymerase sigma factor [Proteobacteria bacterium]|nr:RNA polymerase sigma factor [Pseudomonadota bacterium]
MKLAKNGDVAAFESLVEASYLFVYKVAYKWGGKKEDAEDTTQEVFVKLAARIGGFKETSGFQTWLYRITLNTAKDLARANKRKLARETAYMEDRVAKASVSLQEVSLTEKLHILLEMLPGKLKETAVLVFGEGLNHREAAKALNCAETTISWRIFQVKKKLRKHVERGEFVW